MYSTVLVESGEVNIHHHVGVQDYIKWGLTMNSDTEGRLSL
jgi:hypothetical protein